MGQAGASWGKAARASGSWEISLRPSPIWAARLLSGTQKQGGVPRVWHLQAIKAFGTPDTKQQHKRLQGPFPRCRHAFLVVCKLKSQEKQGTPDPPRETQTHISHFKHHDRGKLT